MSRSIAYRRSDGGTSICTPAPWARLVRAVTVNSQRIEISPPVPFDRMVREAGTDNISPEWAETEDEFLARIMAKDVPPTATEVRIINVADIPADRTYRNALNPDLTHDMVKARDLHRDRVRHARKPLLAELDVIYQRADEAGETAAKRVIAARKQVLRDATRDARIDACRTVADLSALPLPDMALTADDIVALANARNAPAAPDKTIEDMAARINMQEQRINMLLEAMREAGKAA